MKNKRFGNRRKLVFHGSCLMCAKQDKCGKRFCDGFVRTIASKTSLDKVN